jgi:hypothetical protein
MKFFSRTTPFNAKLRRPIAPADDHPTSRIWHSIIVSVRGVVW